MSAEEGVFGGGVVILWKGKISVRSVLRLLGVCAIGVFGGGGMMFSENMKTREMEVMKDVRCLRFPT